MSRRSVTKRKTMQAARRVGAYLTLMVVQQDDNGDMVFSVLPLPWGFAMVTTWLATLWVALTPVVARAWLEIGWLVGDAAAWLMKQARALGRCARWCLDGAAPNWLPEAPMHFYVAVNIIASALWWAVVSSNSAVVAR